MSFPKHHGIEIAKSSWVENLMVERLTQTEENALTLDTVGRIWFNTTNNCFMQTVLDTNGTTIIARPFVTGGEGGTGTLEVQDEGTSVMTGVNALNFIGTSVQAMVGNLTDKKVNVYIPSPAWNSYYNSNAGANDTRVADTSTTTRYISNPTGSTNGGFSIGNWSAGTQQSTVHTSTINYSTTNACLFDDNASHIKVEVFGADGTTVIAVAELTDINNNTTVTVQGITIVVSGWTAFYNKFNAVVGVSINLASLGSDGTALTSGGRFNMKISHIQATGTYTKLQGPLFYEPTTTTNPTLTGVTISEGVVTGKWLSGIKYYTLGDEFLVGVTDLDNLNSITYPQPFITFNPSSSFGISSFTLTSGNLTGWTSAWDNQNASYSATKTINTSSFRYIGTSAQASANWTDWTTGSLVYSTAQSVCIDTYSATSTNTNEDFRDENYRKTSAWAAWTPANALAATDLMVQSDKVMRQTGNWTTYHPGMTNNASYGSGNTQTQYYYRGFKIANVSHSNGIFNITGTNFNQASLDNETVLIWISVDGTNWYKCNDAYMGGVLSNGAGCRINADTQALPNLQFTLGTGGMTASGTGPDGWGIYVKIEMPSGSSVQIDSLRITDW